jgi:mannose-1-phosphate guanylyltransferase
MKMKKPTKAILLVGGEGTRLRPLTYTTTKAMVPVLNRPFIEYQIHHLQSHSVTDIILAMGYKPDSIKNYFGKKSDVTSKISYSIEQVPLGTAGAVKNAIPYIDRNETLFVLNGDVFTDLDLTDMLNFHRTRQAKVTIALTPVDDPTQFGVVELDSNKRVLRFIEKPSRQEVTSNLINAGVYIIESGILERIPQDKRFMFEHDIFPQIISDGEPIYGYPTTAYWIDMGTPQKYLQLNRDILLGKCHLNASISTNNIANQSLGCSQATLIGPVMIDGGCTIGKDVAIKGPSLIGPECKISDSTLIEESILWAKVIVGKRAIIKNCIIANSIHIENNAHIENSVIGHDPISNQTVTIKAKTQ